jgi:hypothetical protein
MGVLLASLGVVENCPTNQKATNAMSWIVPPIIIPALFIVFIAARVVYVAFF